MNPFRIENAIPPELNTIINKLNKKSNVTKEKALNDLVNILNDIDLDSNLKPILKATLPYLSNSDLPIKTASFKIIFRLYCDFKGRKEIYGLTPLLYLHIVENNYKEEARNYIKKSDLVEHHEAMIKLLDVKENKNCFYSVTTLLIKAIGLNEFIKTCILKFTIEIEDTTDLFWINTLLSLTSELDIKKSIYDKLLRVNKFHLIDEKWSIILKYYMEILKENTLCENKLSKESKYIKENNLRVIIDNFKFNFDNFLAADINCFTLLYDVVSDKTQLLINFINSLPVHCLKFDISKFTVDFSKISDSCDFKRFNAICKHNKLHIHNKTGLLHNLNNKEKIIRADILGIELSIDIQPNEIMDIIVPALNVLPLDFFKLYFDELKELHGDIIKRHPSLLNEDSIKLLIRCKRTSVKILHLVGDQKVKDIIIKYMRANYTVLDYLYIYDRCAIPEYLILLFYFNLYQTREFESEKFSEQEVVENYLNHDFIIHLIVEDKIDLTRFINEIYKLVGSFEILNCTSFNDEYFYLRPFFYDNIATLPLNDRNYFYLEYILRILYTIVEKRVNEIQCKSILGSLHILISYISTIILSEEFYNANHTHLPEDFHTKDEFIKNLSHLNLPFIQKCFPSEATLPRQLCDAFSPVLLFSDSCDQNISDLMISLNLLSLQNFDESNYNTFYLIYFLLKRSNILNKTTLKELTKLKNKRIRNLIYESLDFHRYGDIIQYKFKNISIEENLNNLEISNDVDTPNKVLFVIESTSFISNIGLENIFMFETNFKNDFELIIACIGNDFIWETNSPIFKGRRLIMNIFLKGIFTIISNNIINNYSFARFEENTLQDEVFDFMLSSIDFVNNVKKEKNYFHWNLFLNSVQLIRNINVLFFIEKCIQDPKYSSFTNKINDDELSALFANNFPNISKSKITIGKLIESEAKIIISGIKTILLKKTNGYILEGVYNVEDSHFNFSIEMDASDVTKTVFVSNVFVKNLITIKIKNLLKKTRRFIEVMSLWKVNVDNKLQGIGECPICYLVVDGADKTFPDFKCDQCGNKFHKKCLSRWGKESKSMTCPMCRKKMK